MKNHQSGTKSTASLTFIIFSEASHPQKGDKRRKGHDISAEALSLPAD